ncbi:unnamed protein product [Tilletia caries]|nr:unnamed protein product [Tilletia caries]
MLAHIALRRGTGFHHLSRPTLAYPVTLLSCAPRKQAASPFLTTHGRTPASSILRPVSVPATSFDSKKGTDDKDSDKDGLPRQEPKLLVPLLVTFLGFGLVHSAAAVYSETQTQHLVEKYNLPVIRDQPETYVTTSSSTLPTLGEFCSFFASVTLEQRDAAVGNSSHGDGPANPRARSRLQDQLDKAQTHDLADKLGILWRSVVDKLSFLPRADLVHIKSAYNHVAKSYLDLTPSQRAVVPIIGINTLVFLGFRLRSAGAQAFMWRHFTHQPNSQRYYTMVTSTFAHTGFLHFAVNNFALWQFSHHFIRDPVFQEGRGKFDYALSLDPRVPHVSESGGYLPRTNLGITSESGHDPQSFWENIPSSLADYFNSTNWAGSHWTPDASPSAHFFAFWVSAGLAASFGSQLWAFARFRNARSVIISQMKAMRGSSASIQKKEALASRLQHLRTIGSAHGLGASGAMLATVGAVATCRPEDAIGIVFLPQTSVPSQTAVSGLILLDAVGLLLTLLTFPLGMPASSSIGHAAHLAGTGFGICD